MANSIRCERCNGEGWLELIDGWSDGSQVTSRPCPRCSESRHLTQAEQRTLHRALRKSVKILHKARATKAE